jgi:hypothetical protein
LQRKLARTEVLLQQLEDSQGRDPPVHVLHASDDPALRQEIRRLLQEELRAYVGAHPTSAQPGQAVAAASASAQPQPPPDPEQEHERALAYERAQNLLTAALSSHAWDQDQAREMRALLHKLPGDQSYELRGKLLSAMNRGEIVPNGPPL